MTERPDESDARTRKSPVLDRFDEGTARRVAITVSCGDADSIPKVAGAGEIRLLDGLPVQVMHNGVVVEEGGYFGPWMDEIIRCLRGHHEPQEERVFFEILQRLHGTPGHPYPRAMLELGSFWAYYSLWFGSEFPDATLVGLEPDPAFFEVGRRNFDLNQRSGLLLHGAIGEPGSGSLDFVAASNGRTYEVPVYSVRALMDQADLQHLDLLLADIQGAETSLLTGEQDLLRSGAVRFLIVSTHHHSISGSALTHQDALLAIQDMGGFVIAEHTVGESFSGDGLIAASFDPVDRGFTVPISYARQRDSLFGELEYSLADVMIRARTAEDEVDRLSGELVKERSALSAATSEIMRVRGSRVWRWSSGPRTLYGRIRRTSSQAKAQLR